MLLCFSFSLSAQRDLNPRNKKKAFGGARSFKDYNLYGFQVQVGGTYLMSKLNNERINVDGPSAGFRGNFLHDPYGKLGAFAEIGMFHFPKKLPKLRISKDKVIVLISYYDWGLGFKYFRGGEKIGANFEDALGAPIGSEEQDFNFSNGNVFGRFSIHKNVHFKPKGRREKVNFFLDNSLGINVDYRLLQNSDNYSWYSVMTEGEQYYKPLHVQMHYGLGFGFSPKRGSFLIPGVRLPILGYQSTLGTSSGSAKGENHFGKPSLHWFSSRYWPIMFTVKYMFALPKRPKGCATGITNEQDKETQRGR
jgi:hypothetical protein